jgi:tRNA(Ser,Leu) C12 N-acetylase TAN1
VLSNITNIITKFGHFVDIYYPQWTISVQIVHHLMCLSLLENYQEYHEYRLHKKGKI